MNFSFFNVLRFLLFFLFGGPFFAEVYGYFWHRFAEHLGWFGNIIRYRHWIHHDVDYPVDNLRSAGTLYNGSLSWSWYIGAGGGITLAFVVLPVWDAFPIALGASLYGKFVAEALHRAFHTEGHYLAQFKWFRKSMLRHDIHHWARANYGIAFFFMDRAFGTLRDEICDIHEETFPGLETGTQTN